MWKGSGLCLKTTLTLSPYVSWIFLSEPVTRLQNGHWKSLNSTMVTKAFSLPPFAALLPTGISTVLFLLVASFLSASTCFAFAARSAIGLIFLRISLFNGDFGLSFLSCSGLGLSAGITGFFAVGTLLPLSASSILVLKLAKGCAPVSFLPLIKKFGVPRTPILLA